MSGADALAELDPLAVPLTGTHLVEASAGTGKTYTIATLFVRLVVERRLEVGRILVVTYTVAATAELRERIRSRLVAAAAAYRAGGAEDPVLDAYVRERIAAGQGEVDRARLERAVRDFDEAAVSTIHGFCQRVLQENAFESGASFETELVGDAGPLVEEVLSDWWTATLHDAPAAVVQYAKKQLPLELARKLAFRVMDPALPVEPPAPPPADLPPLQARWTQCFEEAHSAWSEGREEVAQLLRTPSMRNAYKSNWLPRWLDEVEAGFQSPDDGLCKNFHRFGTHAVEQGCNRDKGPLPDHPLFAAFERMVEADSAWRVALEGHRLALMRGLVDAVREQLARKKAERDVFFFDDLLRALGEGLAGAGGSALAEAIRSRFPVALVDEFQDTDPVQYEVFRRVWHGAPGGGLFLIGDPKQAIYSFRGADVFAYLAAGRDADARHTLVRNWRSDPQLVAGLNALFAEAPNPFVLDEIAYAPARPAEGAEEHLEPGPVGAALRVLFVERTREPPSGKKARSALSKGFGEGELIADLAADVGHLLDSDARIDGAPVSPGDVAVLCRTNKQTRLVQEALRAAGIPSVLQTEESVFESEDAEELQRLMHAMAEPERESSLRAALATTLIGAPASALDALERDEEVHERWSARYRGLGRTWVERGFVPAMRRLLELEGLEARLLARRDGERRLTNLLHLLELLHGAASQERLGPLALIHWLGRRRAEAAARGGVVAEEAQVRLESDADAVQLVTVHRAKGLEYPITYCPFLWDGGLLQGDDKKLLRFHDEEVGRHVLDLGSEERDVRQRRAEREALAENLRLLYVALTRARHHCTVVWGAFDKAGSSPLGWLLEPPLDAPPDPKRLAERTDERLRARLEELVRDSDGAIAVQDLASRPPSGWKPTHTAPAPESLAARPITRSLPLSWRTSSFSGLVASGARARTDPAFAEGRDWDAHQTGEGAAERAAEAGARVRLADFPAGTTPGIAIHEIFEHGDFEAGEPAALEPVVQGALARHGLAASWCEPLVASVGEVLATPLSVGDERPRLAGVSRAARIDELEFTFPVRPTSAALSSGALAKAFQEHGASAFVRGYGARLAKLGFPPLAGYLRGFVDLVFRDDAGSGRWFLVDYKSNRLGVHPDDYAPARLEPVMAAHHYVLQYHLYWVALHRLLRGRLPDYDYDRDMGGVLYLFVRGMAPWYGPNNGVFADRPPRALVEALDRCLARAADEQGPA